MDLRVLTFALSMFLVFGFGEGEEIKKIKKCHQCNGHTDAECADPFGSVDQTSGDLVVSDKFLKDCPEKATMCRKIYQDVRGVVRVIRSCAWEKYTRDGEEKSDTCYKTVMEEYNTYVCTCTDKDGCNGAENIHVSALLIAILPIITLGLFNQ